MHNFYFGLKLDFHVGLYNVIRVPGINISLELKFVFIFIFPLYHSFVNPMETTDVGKM